MHAYASVEGFRSFDSEALGLQQASLGQRPRLRIFSIVTFSPVGAKQRTLPFVPPLQGLDHSGIGT